jgi:hypothetical protein
MDTIRCRPWTIFVHSISALALSTVLLCGDLPQAQAQAGSQYSKAVRQARAVRKAKEDLAQAVARLNVDDRQRLQSALARAGTDSDGDGVDDDFEDAVKSNKCSRDSDSDGTPDSSDGYPSDSGKTEEIEVAAVVEELTATSITLFREGTFAITAATKLKGRIEKGACVKLEGYKDTNGNLFAKEVELKFGCPRSGSGSD